MSRAGALHRLQTIDSDLDARRARLREIEALLVDAATVRAAQSQLAEAEAHLAEARKTARALEEEIQSIARKTTEVEGQLYGGRVRNPKELQGLQAETASLEKRRAGLEDELLEAMVGVDEAEKVQQAALAVLASAQALAAQAQTALMTERAEFESRVAKLEVEREAAEAPIPPDDRALYRGLRERKRGVAVARLTDGACGSCGVAPSSSRVQAARQGGELIRCGNCERVLYAE